MLTAALLKSAHEAALAWDDYLASDPAKAAPWRQVYARATLAPEQVRLVRSFVRRMPVLCLSGIWCGDCAQQGPLLQRIAEASDALDLRFVDRDEHPDLAGFLKINGGSRVPVVVFMAEDHELVFAYGDRTITRYRAVAARKLGPACPVPGAPVPEDELRGTLQDWLDEFERAQLLLRLSPRLRERHGD